MLEKLFKLRENDTTVKTEVIAGLTTFMTMAYILAVNPSMLNAAGMDTNAALIATALAAFIGTLAMAFLANYPFALASGMGLNAYFAYTVCGSMGYSWQVALLAVFAEGIVFIALSLTNVREAIFNAIPLTLKHGVSAGIGLFIAFVGLQGAHLVVNSDSTLTTTVDFAGNFHTEGICAVLAIVGLFITIVLYIKGFKGAILIGIIATWILGMIMQAVGVYQVDVEGKFYSLFPNLAFVDLTDLGKTFGQCFRADLSGVSVINFIVVLLSFLFVDIFDTLGTLVGVATKADMLDSDGKTSSYQTGTFGRCNRYFCRCNHRYFYNDNVCRIFCRRSSRRTYRIVIRSNRTFVPGLHLLRTDLYSDSWFCHGSCFDLCRIFDGIFRNQS